MLSRKSPAVSTHTHSLIHTHTHMRSYAWGSVCYRTDVTKVIVYTNARGIEKRLENHVRIKSNPQNLNNEISLGNLTQNSHTIL